MFAPNLKTTHLISLLLILASGMIGSRAHAEVYKCKINGKIEYRAKKCAKGSERDIQVPLNLPKTPDYKAIAAEQLAQQQQQEIIDNYKKELNHHKNNVRRQQNKLNELSRNREDAIQLLKQRAQRLDGGDSSAMKLRKALGEQIRESRAHYDQQINIAQYDLSKASAALKAFLSQPKPKGYNQAEQQSSSTGTP